MTPSSSSAADKAALSPLSPLMALFALQRESAGMRWIARTVLATWLLPLFFALLASFGAPAARAQGAVGVTAPGVTPTVVVLDFAVANGLDPLYGRKAADGLAVELQRSGQYEVVPRQTVETAVTQQAGLQAPFNDTAQVQLAQAVNAGSVFSGTVRAVQITPGKLARVTVEARQLDVVTGDYINGAIVTESTEQKLGAVANEILVDEAINKAVFAAVRSMRQTTLPIGTVLNTTVDTVELSIGANAGVVAGQRYTVLRDKFDGTVTRRSKIGELTIVRVDADQSTARLSAGGGEGVRTGDRVREIFEASNYPTSSVGRNGTSISSVNAPVRRTAKEGGFVRKTQAGLYGLLGLAALVAFAGFGGGGNDSSPSVSGIREANPTGTFPMPRFNFSAGFSGINASQSLQRESVVAYLVYRGTAPNFTPTIGNLQAVIDARLDSSGDNIIFTDSVDRGFVRRTATFSSTTGTTGGTAGSSINFSLTDAAAATGSLSSSITNDQITLTFAQQPLVIGQTYYYRVARITAERRLATTTGTGTGTGTTNASTINLSPSLSRISTSTGAYTPLFLPIVVPNPNGYDTDNFSLRINTDFTAFTQFTSFIRDNNGNIISIGNSNVGNYSFPNRFYVGSGVTQFRFEVSTTQSFARSSTFVSPDITAPPFTSLGADVVLDLGNASNIRIPSSASNPYVPGVTPLYVRVLARNTNDENPVFRVGPTFTIQNAAGLDRTAVGSRFLDAPAGGAGRGINLPGVGGGGLARRQGGSNAPRVLVPRN